MAQSPHGVQHSAHRPVVMGRRGMVVAGHPLASQAGITMLQKGGNAVDAAIAVAAALNVVEPLMSGIGGDGFIMVHHKAQDDIKVVNATGAAPYAAHREQFLPNGIPMKGAISASVPGLLKGWVEAHQRYGTLKLGEVLEPAIDLAANGFPVSRIVAASIANDPVLCQFPTSRAVFTRDGRPLSAGQMLYQRDLARTFQRIASDGDGVFYQGEIAREIARFCHDQHGLLTEEDLADHHVRWQEPISTTYRGYTVYEAPPNSSGHVLLQELNLVEQFDLASLGCMSPQAIHLMVEAKKRAFADREAYMADPEWVDVPVAGLLSKEYARDRASSIDLEQASQHVIAGDPLRYQGNGQPPVRPAVRSGPVREDTTCFCVVDQWGNAVCQLQSIQTAWGSSVIAGNSGVLLNNRMTYWHLEEDHVDCLQPGKRVRHTMNPVMVFRPLADGGRELVLVCGTPGADTQVQTNLQVITHVLDYGMTVTEAVEAPRWRHEQDGTESTYPHRGRDVLEMEARFPASTRQALEGWGHQVEALGEWSAQGSEVMIRLDPSEGALMGGADPRRDAYAIGW